MTRDEAIKELRGFIGQLTEGCQEAIKVLIPELAESEDERMIKAIVDALLSHSNSINLLSLRGFQIEDVKAWLDKQKEQKPKNILTNDDSLQTAYLKGQTDVIEDPEAYGLQKKQKQEWSEEDSSITEELYEYFSYLQLTSDKEFSPSLSIDKILSWLKSLKNRGNSLESNTNSPSWSEEDDAHLKWLCRIIHSQVVNKKLSLAEESELGNWMDKWLNHKPQSHWKPSEEQMRAFHELLGGKVPRAPELYELYNDLEKLM